MWRTCRNGKNMIRKLLYAYVNWERMWFESKLRLEVGDVVKYNWKAKVFFTKDSDEWWDKERKEMLVVDYPKDGVVDTDNGCVSLYWLKKV